VRVRGVTRGGYKEQVRGYCREARSARPPEPVHTRSSLACLAQAEQLAGGPKIRDEILDDVTPLGGMGFSVHFLMARAAAGVSVNRPEAIFAVSAGVFKGLRDGSAAGVWFRFPKARRAPRITTSAEWHLLPA